MAIIVGLVWFQVPQTEPAIADRYGFIFFLVVYWGFQPLIGALNTFAVERVIIQKERASGSYRLSGTEWCRKVPSKVNVVLSLVSTCTYLLCTALYK